MIIGLTGTIAAGKTALAEILKKKGFAHYTYSDILRIEAKKRNIDPTRKNLQDLGNKVKEESNNQGILSRMIIENAKTSNIIADGIRTPDEIKELKKNPDTIIIGIDAPQLVRYDRLISRKRKGDPISFDEFKKVDDHENLGLTAGQNIGECLKIVDHLIVNDSTFDVLSKRIEEILTK